MKFLSLIYVHLCGGHQSMHEVNEIKFFLFLLTILTIDIL